MTKPNVKRPGPGHPAAEALPLEAIRRDGGTQPRAELCSEVVAAYCDALEDGALFPPVVVFYDGEAHWLADGFHRVESARQAGRAEIAADVRQGSRRDAVLFSVGANATHGLPRSNADKRRAALTLLRDEEWAKWSDREISRRCAVSHQFVSNLRGELSVNGGQLERKAQRGGTVYTIDTANIGQAIGHTPANDVEADIHGAALTEEQQRALIARFSDDVVAGEQRDRRVARAKANAAQNDEVRQQSAAIPDGKYRCIVIDPPWPMQKIARDQRPNQVGFDYPTMTEDELMAFPVSDVAANDSHLYLWTTQKYLPMALRLAEHWGFNYQCLLTWVKNVGFTPFSWMYSTEHVLFCRRGNLELLKKGERLDFAAKVREHSRKPSLFYDLVRRVSPGPRVDVFSREHHEGFVQWGNETGKFQGAA